MPGRHLDQVVVGSAALIENEIVRVIALNPQTQQLTLARGCVDTVPVAHPAGSRVWFYEDYAAGDSTEYVDGETVQAKLLTRTSSQQLEPALAPVDQVTLDQRAFKPYPPQQLKVEGTATPTEVFGEIPLTWVHRDRKLQADQLVDASQGSIGPEPGTTYTARLYRPPGTLRTTTTNLTGASTLLAHDVDGAVEITLHAMRDGVASMQAPQQRFTFVAGYRLIAQNTDGLLSEAGDTLITE